MLAEEEKVSIVLPTFNGERYLRQSLESCLKQTYRNIEVLIVDDGSTDATPQIIHSYGDNRIISIRQDQNRGLPHSLNSGFAAATGRFLTWTSDDNYYETGAIENILNFLKSKKASFVYGDFYLLTDNAAVPPRLIQLEDPPVLEIRNSIGPFFLYTREVMDAVGRYDEEAPLVEDYDYWLRVLKKYKLFHLNQAFYYYRDHDKSLTSIYARFLEMHILKTLLHLKNNYADIHQASRSLLDYIAERNWLFQFQMKAFRWHLVNPRMYKKLLVSQFCNTKVRYETNKLLKAFAEKSITMPIACRQLSAIMKQYI